MKFGSILAIYFLFWAASAFFLLPFGVRTDEEVGKQGLAAAASPPVGEMHFPGKKRCFVR